MELETIIRQRVIRETKTEYDLVISEVKGKIEALQDVCKHPNVTKVSRSDTGNYDPYEDRYWKEYSCPDCDKRWTDYL